MYWDRNRPRFLRCAAAALLVCGATAAAANVLIVRSTGPSAKDYPAGKKLSDNAPIVLKASDVVVLLDGRGTRTLQGPGNFTPSGPAQPATRGASFAGLASGQQRRARVGAVRDVGTVARPPTLWHVDVGAAGPVCVADANALMLWRADASKSATLIIADADGGAHKIDWPIGQPIHAWPMHLRVYDGARYQLSWNEAPAGTFTFRTVGTVPQDVQTLAAELIERGCEAQINLLIAATPSRPDAS